MKQYTKEEAIAFFDAKKWEGMTALERASFQIQQGALCMPFDVFLDAVNEVTGEQVTTVGIAMFKDEFAAKILAIQEDKREEEQ